MTRKIFSMLVVVAVLSSLFVFSPATVEVAEAQGGGNTIIYNIFATDGYTNMADGTSTYIYGFIGGRAGVGLNYYDASTQTAVPYNAPAPTGGERAANEIPLMGHAQLPGPAIYAEVNDVVEIRFKNLGVQANPIAPNDPHSIHLHGLDVDAANDGVPETSVGAVPANLCADGSSDTTAPYDCAGAPGGLASGAGNVIVYMFTATTPATSMWHCHQEADIHVQMGMYGALVIYNQGDPAAANGGPGSGFGGRYNGFYYDKDIIMLLSEVDQGYHASEGGTYDAFAGIATFSDTGNTNYTIGTTGVPAIWNPIDYHPQYWLINGLSFPNTVQVSVPGVFDWNEWHTAYPNYDPLIAGSVSLHGYSWTNQWQRVNQPGEKILIRMINMGYETQPMHIHGYHMKVLGSDQRPWPWANRVLWGRPTPFDQGLEKNTILIGSGETYELLVDMGQQSATSMYETGTETRYFDGSAACETSLGPGPYPAVDTPVSNTATGCPEIPDAGNPANPNYIAGPTVTGLVGLGGTSQVFPFHNHDDYKATNNGAYPGGMFTAVIPLP